MAARRRHSHAGRQRGLAVAVDVHLHGLPLFYCAMPGTTPDNAEWIRRKRNVVLRFFRSLYAVGLKYQARGITLEAATGLARKTMRRMAAVSPCVSRVVPASAPSPPPACRSVTTTGW